jgi:putative peptide zinc metalloprotease protein
MGRRLFSNSWHSVADLRPRLVPQARITRHVYRGQTWFVVQDQSGGRFHRLSPAAHELLMRMDGTRSVQALWEAANVSGNGEICTQDEIVDLLVQLHAADLLQADTTPDSAALLERRRKKRQQTIKQWLLNPMSIKIPLLDPDPFLARWAPRLAWCFGRTGLLVWLAAVLPALLLAAQNWHALTTNMSDRVLSSSNLLVMAIVFPFLKVAHELGHGFAARVWGGAVHQMGVMLLVFAPVPYVDTSASASFASKYQRAAVAAAGMMVELFIAALAMFVWVLAEPGIVRAVAYNVMLIAGVSTLVVNGNPLLRYDGYYILTDLIEMPNLAQRGQKYLAWWWDRKVFGVHDQEPPPESASERRWLFWYTPLAWLYRLSVTVSIILFVGGSYFIFGTLFALWGAFSLVGMPLWKAWKHVMYSPTLQRRRQPAVRVAGGIALAALAIAFLLPMPLRTRAEGVIWLPDQSLLYAGGGGFFERWLVEPGTRVAEGTPLFVLKDDLLTTELAVAKAKVEEAEARYRAEQFANPAKGAIARRQLEQEQEVLRRTDERSKKLVGYAQADGVLVAARTPIDMPGQHFRKGEVIGYVLEKHDLIARVAVQQDDIDLVRNRYRKAWLRLAETIDSAHPAKLVRVTPGGTNDLPTAALGVSGGGAIPTAPDDRNGVKALERIFLLDLQLAPDILPAAFGERVFVRFEHGFEPLGLQGLRRLRQLFLSRFGV